MADNSVYLQDMLEHIEILETFLPGSDKQAFLSDVEKQFAAARALEIIGEASGKLSEEFRTAHPEIDWRGLKSMGNLLIHEYAHVDAEEVWKAYETDISSLKQQLEAI